MNETFVKISQFVPVIEQAGLRVLAFVTVVGCGYLLGKASISGLNRLADQKKMDSTSVLFAKSCLKVFFQVSTLLLALGVTGVDTTSVAAILGAFSFAAGLAMKNLLANAASGFVLVLFGHFKVGDQVEIAGTLGEVDAINIFDTTLISEGRKIVIPNGKVVGEKQVIIFCEHPPP